MLANSQASVEPGRMAAAALAAHRRAMAPDADLSPAGVAELIVEFLDRLELRDVTLVGVDTGGVRGPTV